MTTENVSKLAREGMMSFPRRALISLLAVCAALLSMSACSNAPTEASSPGTPAGATDSTGAHGGSGGAGSEAQANAKARAAWLDEECPWPGDGRAALSLTYDDAMPTHLSKVAPLLRERGLQATFFLTKVSDTAPWRALLDDGHELAAHTQNHPCPESYATPGAPLEDYTLESFAAELDADLAQLDALGAPEPRSFAYPCGATWLGNNRESYVPLVEDRFVAARSVGPTPSVTWPSLHQVSGEFGLDTDQELQEVVDNAVERSQWAVVGFHGVGGDWLVTEEDVHARFIEALARRGDIWVAPFVEVALCAKAAGL